MRKLLYIALVGIVIVIFYDIVGSLLSRSLGFDYSWLAFGSLAIYVAVGFVGSRETVLGGVIAATLVGFADATFGWYLSWLIEPLTKIEEITIFTIVLVIPFVTILAAITGLIGAIAGRWLLTK